MAKTELIFNFYDSVDSGTKGKLINIAGRYRTLIKKTNKEWIDHAAEMRLAHELCTPTNGFSKWLRQEEIDRKTAYGLISLDKLVSCRNDLQLQADGGMIDITGLFELAKESTPREAVTEVAKAAQNGKHIAAKDVKAIIGKHKSKRDESRNNTEPTDEDFQVEEPEPEDDEEPSIDDIMADHVSQIESFCRNLKKQFKETWFSDPWTDAVYDSCESKLSSMLTHVRSCKGHRICPQCAGDGCKVCKRTGWVDRSTSEQLS